MSRPIRPHQQPAISDMPSITAPGARVATPELESLATRQTDSIAEMRPQIRPHAASVAVEPQAPAHPLVPPVAGAGARRAAAIVTLREVATTLAERIPVVTGDQVDAPLTMGALLQSLPQSAPTRATIAASGPHTREMLAAPELDRAIDARAQASFALDALEDTAPATVQRQSAGRAAGQPIAAEIGAAWESIAPGLTGDTLRDTMRTHLRAARDAEQARLNAQAAPGEHVVLGEPSFFDLFEAESAYRQREISAQMIIRRYTRGTGLHVPHAPDRAAWRLLDTPAQIQSSRISKALRDVAAWHLTLPASEVVVLTPEQALTQQCLISHSPFKEIKCPVGVFTRQVLHVFEACDLLTWMHQGTQSDPTGERIATHPMTFEPLPIESLRRVQLQASDDV